jgi:poly(beta-D-mannuronate) lyase
MGRLATGKFSVFHSKSGRNLRKSVLLERRMEISVCPRILSPKLYTMVLVVLLPGSCAAAKDYWVSPDIDVTSVVKQISAGDSIILQDGLWHDVELKFERLPGTGKDSIYIRAETAGQVVFTGQSQLRLSGNHVIVSGLVFRNTNGASDVLQLRSHSKRHAHKCRVTDCVFEQTSESESGPESRWLSVYGTKNRVDHCYFGGKRNRGATLVVWVSEGEGEHRIDHNYFGPRPVLGSNGGETIRIGTSDVSDFNCRTLVEDNYFHECNGEAEIVSNKSCENTYRHNVFDACSGALTLRHGHRCLVDSNVFLGRRQRGTGGVRVIGQNHSVTNNYFEGLRGDAERAAICLMNGIPDGPLNGYAPVREASVVHNTFIDCKVTMEIGVGAGHRQSAAPGDCRITHNAFLPDKWPLFRIHAEPFNFLWDSNRHQVGRSDSNQHVQFERVDLRFKRDSDGLMRPTATESICTDVTSAVKKDLDGHPRRDTSLAGCDDPDTPKRSRPSALSTGPTWRESGESGNTSRL